MTDAGVTASLPTAEEAINASSSIRRRARILIRSTNDLEQWPSISQRGTWCVGGGVLHVRRGSPSSPSGTSPQDNDSRERFAILNNAVGRAWYAQQEDFLLFLDPPQHTRIRKLATRAFTPRYVERMRDVVIRRTTQLLDDLVANGSGDLIADFALSLPMAIICDILGVPIEYREDFRRWTSALVAALEPLPPEHVQDAADEAPAAFDDYFTHLVRHRREHLSEDLLSRLIAVQEGEQRLTEREVVATAILLLAAGFETTTSLIGNGRSLS